MISLLFILTLLFATIYIAPVKVDAVGPTVLATIRWDPGEEIQEAEVKPGQHGVVVFSGRVQVELVVGGAVQKIIVDLQATSEQGWSVIIDPPKMTLSSGEEAPFTATVTVPSETSFYVTDTIMVSGKAVVYPGIFQDIIDPITATVKVKQFCKFSISCCEMMQEGYLNDYINFDLRICNLGNGRDTFIVDITNWDELSRNDLSVVQDISVLEIDARDEDYVTFAVSIPSSKSALGTYTISIKVESEFGTLEGSSLPKTIVLTLKIIEGSDSIYNQDEDTYDPPSEEDLGLSSQFLPGFEILYFLFGVFIIIFISKNRKYKFNKRY